MQALKAFFIFSLCLLASGCVSYHTQLKNPEINSSIFIKDDRPLEQRDHGMMSLNLSSCKYGSLQIGDTDINPSKIVLLQSYLGKTMENELAGKSITLKNYTIHANNAAAPRGTLSGMYEGVLAT